MSSYRPRRAIPSAVNTPTSIQIVKSNGVKKEDAEKILTEFIDMSENIATTIPGQPSVANDYSSADTGLSNNTGNSAIISQLKRLQRDLRGLPPSLNEFNPSREETEPQNKKTKFEDEDQEQEKPNKKVKFSESEVEEAEVEDKEEETVNETMESITKDEDEEPKKSKDKSEKKHKKDKKDKKDKKEKKEKKDKKKHKNADE